MPQEYKINILKEYAPIVFENYLEVEDFLNKPEPSHINSMSTQLYHYEVVFGDGDSFLGEGLSWEELRNKHDELTKLVKHMESCPQ